MIECGWTIKCIRKNGEAEDVKRKRRYMSRDGDRSLGVIRRIARLI